ncbi:MAG: S-layer homology domain-containing protein [Candidatus Cloacimonetes bacterium]|nr:S-layer homology domain-containing protein [Candidatus Cloacimonadota bacterium]
MKKSILQLALSLALCSPILANYNPASSMGSPYSDIDPSHWAYKQIRSLYDAGILRADGTGTFKGNERISRYEAVGLVYSALQHVNRMRSAGGNVDPHILDTINSLITELTDEMQVAEVRIEENADAIAQLRNYVHSMYGRPTQGVTFPLGNHGGRLKLSGQAMTSLVMGGANSAYGTAKSNNSPNVPGTTTNRYESTNQFSVDYLQLGVAADIDHKTSFFTRGLFYLGGNTSGGGGNFQGAPLTAATTGPGGSAPSVPSGLSFNDYMYLHVKDMWADWDFSVGRMYVPWGHETGGAFSTNPYFVSNSMVDMLYGGLFEGIYFTREDSTRSWDWGIGIHNGALATPANAMNSGAGAAGYFASGAGTGFYNHLYPSLQPMLASGAVTGRVAGLPANTTGILPGGGHTGAAYLGANAPRLITPFNVAGTIAFNNNLTNNKIITAADPAVDSVVIPAAAGTNGLGTNDDKAFGFLLHLGNRSKNNDFMWDFNYFDNGGKSTRSGAGTAANPYRVSGYGKMSFFNLGATYKAHNRWKVSMEYVAGSVENLYYHNNNKANGVNVYSDDFSTWYIQPTYHLTARSDISLRYGTHSYDSHDFPNQLDNNDEYKELAIAWTRRVSDNGTLILENNSSEWSKLGGLSQAQLRPPAGPSVATENKFNVMRASYRIDF